MTWSKQTLPGVCHHKRLTPVRFCLWMIVLSLVLPSCGKPPTVEQQIIAKLETMESDAEDGRYVDFMKHIARDFKGQQGALTRQDFQRFMLLQINESRRVQANFFPIRVVASSESIDAREASARFRMLVTGGEGFLPDRGQLLDVSTGWVRDDGDWLLRSANWEAAQIED